MAGMECVVTNLMEPGDEAIVAVNGVFGGRMVDVMQRAGVTVHALEKEWGTVFSKEEIAEAVAKYPRAKAVALVHAETSTGAHQPLEGMAEITRGAGMLLVVDAVTSLGGHPVEVDAWGIDAIYSGTQKCLSCPPGLSPVSFSGAALEKIESRESKVQSWYFDVSMLRDYYRGSGKRAYHHTAPVNMVYALREALKIVMEEGLDARFERHRAMHERLRSGLEAMGITYVPERSLHTLNCVSIPEGADDAAVRGRLLENYSLEIGAGLGPFAGKAWRIGLMGHAATRANVDLVLAALKDSIG
jgi:alanine-glyoxylate transaminase/serine-glyoxylate transaminase/serine-pyruvate transaminase